MTRERLFRFNPFEIENWTEEQVIEQYKEHSNNLIGDDTPFGIANDIELYSDMGYLIGEMIARYSESVSNDEVILKTNIADDVYRERDVWLKQSVDKPPAMTYFQAKATSKYIKESILLNQKESKLKRFKYAYDSIQDKQNALKKKLESVRLDMGR